MAPDTTYTYEIAAEDFHLNQAAHTAFSVTTPPAGTNDARRTGVRPSGAYWGGRGEQIDLLSGAMNLHSLSGYGGHKARRGIRPAPSIG